VNGKQLEMYDILCGLDGETVANLFLDWHGTCLLSDGFRGHLCDEGYLDDEEEQ